MTNITIKQTLSAIVLFGALATANAADVNSIQGRAAPVADSATRLLQITGTPVTQVLGRAAFTVSNQAAAKIAGSVRSTRLSEAPVANRLGRA